MAIRLYRAYSPGTRSRSSLYLDDLSKNKPERSLTFGKKRCSGRNNRGVITLKGRGGSHKRKYRMIDFRRNEASNLARVVGIEYDPTEMHVLLGFTILMERRNISLHHDH